MILNLAVWSSLHTLFGTVEEVRRFGVRIFVPDLGTLDPVSAVIAAGAFPAVFRLKLGMIRVLAGSVAAGAAWHLIFRG